MIDPVHELPISKQAKALGISRGCVYYVPKPVPPVDLAIMRRIDELHLNYPFAGSWMMAALLANQGVDVGRRHVRTLMKKMGVEAIYRKPNTSKPAVGHKIYPHLLRKLKVERLNQVSPARRRPSKMCVKTLLPTPPNAGRDAKCSVYDKNSIKTSTLRHRIN